MIDPSVAGLLRTKYTIRVFYFSALALLVCTGAAAYVLSIEQPQGVFSQILLSALTSLAGSIIVVMFVYGVWIILTPPELRNAIVEPVRAGEVGEIIDGLTKGAKEYWFFGRSGNYFRAVVLPRLDEESRRARRSAHIRVVIPNAWRGANSTTYATRISQLGEKADDNTLPISVLATILAAIEKTSANPELLIEIGLTPTVPVVRFDLSDRGAILTRDEKSLPAVFCNNGNPFFDMFRSIVDNELLLSNRVSWAPRTKLSDLKSPTDIADAIKGLPPIDQFILDEALELVKTQKHRYA